MFPTAYYPIEANRYVPHSDYLEIEGFDFTGATFKMQVRDAKNGGFLRADVVPTVVVTMEGATPVSTVSWEISEATMETMPVDPDEPNKDVIVYYDVHITPSGGDKFVAFAGPFTVKAGATQ